MHQRNLLPRTRGGAARAQMVAFDRPITESVTVTVPYVGLREGRFENHWVMTLEAPDRPLVYFGTPLLVETEVDAG